MISLDVPYVCMKGVPAIGDAIASNESVKIRSGSYTCQPFALGVGQNLYGDGIREGNGATPTVLVCDTGTAAPGVFCRVPAFNRVKDIKLKATSKTAGYTGMRLSQTEYGWANQIELDNVYIDGFDVGLAVNSAFLCRYRDVVVANCRYGARWLPSDDASDNGYYTTQWIDRLSCWGSEDVGLSITPVGISSTFDFQKLDIENNCKVSGTYQAYMENIRGRIGMLYAEASPTDRAKDYPCLRLKNATIEIDGAYINGTQGIDLGADANTLTLTNCKGTGAGDIVRGTGGTNQKVNLIRCTFEAWPSLAAGTKVVMEDCTIAGVFYPGRNDSYWDGASRFIGQTIRDVRSWQKQITATIDPGKRVRIVGNTNISYAGGAAGWQAGTVGFASFANFSHEDLVLTVTTSADGNGTFFNVHAYHMSTGPAGDGLNPTSIVITDKTLNVTLMRANSPVSL